jgi:hypothetical protein
MSKSSKATALLCLCIAGLKAYIVPDSLWDAIEQVETGGERDPANAKGDNGASIGWLQISQAVIDDVNERCFPSGPKWTLKDARDRHRARIIGQYYIGLWCREERLGRVPTEQDVARIWNGGPDGWKKKSTIRYWNKVKKHL